MRLEIITQYNQRIIKELHPWRHSSLLQGQWASHLCKKVSFAASIDRFSTVLSLKNNEMNGIQEIDRTNRLERGVAKTGTI
tara:strand:+ start:1548 stop:1790 length:243 start_codon:yes stop_codon:yes gene_type:complete